MEIPDITSNSIKDLSTVKKRTDITDYAVMPSSTVSTTAHKKEKGKGWLLNLILPEDVPDLMTYFKLKKDDMIKYVVWPKIQDILYESFGTLLGVNITRKSSSVPGSISRVSYDTKYQRVGSNSSRQLGEPIKVTSPRYSIYENIGFDSAEEADTFMSMVEDLFDDQNGYITVLQFYNIARRPTSPEQNNYGWLSLGGMKRMYSGGRYYIDMSWPVPLN